MYPNLRMIVLGALVFSLVLTFFVSRAADGALKVYFFDVGQGDSIFIETENKKQILIDGGPSNSVVNNLAEAMPFWDRTIDLVILTHPDSDHYQGLTEVIKRYKIDNFLNNGLSASTQVYEVLKKGVGGRGIRQVMAKRGTGVRVGKIYLDIVAPEEASNDKDSNDNSLVIDLKYGDFEAILPGDAPKVILNTILVKQPLDYLKLSHHGSKTGTDVFTLGNFMPKLAIISVGKNNYGHPDEGIIKILRDKNIKILRTDEIGDIEIISDGKVVKVNH